MRNNKNKWDLSEERRDFLKENYTKIGSVKISELWGWPVAAVHKKAKQIGLRFTKEELKKILEESNIKKLKFKQEDLDCAIKLCSPEFAYSLGFIWADGHVSKSRRNGLISISIQRADANEILPILKTWANWKEYKISDEKRPKNWKSISTLYISSRVIADYLLSLDFGEKSIVSPQKVINTLQDSVKPYFFRGVIDGDGHIDCRNKTCILVISSTHGQDWTYFEDICKELEVNYKINRLSRHNKKSNKNNRSSSFAVTGKANVLKVLSYAYNNVDMDNIGLSRKIDKFYEVRDADFWSSITKEQRDVSRFMRKAGQKTPCSPTIPCESELKLRYNLISEELEELKEAMGYNGNKFDSEKVDLTACADALIDLLYVTYGGLVSFGLNGESLWKAVHENNMTKFVDGYVDENGKLRKGPSYKPVDLTELVYKQINSN